MSGRDFNLDSFFLFDVPSAKSENDEGEGKICGSQLDRLIIGSQSIEMRTERPRFLMRERSQGGMRLESFEVKVNGTNLEA
jgi:hypothetical protein